MRILDRVSPVRLTVFFCAALSIVRPGIGLALDDQPPTTQPAPAPVPPPVPAPAPAPAPAPVPAPTTQASEEGFTTTPTGLKYKDLKVGDGLQPQKGDRLSVHCTGTLEDGSTFFSTVEGGQPIEFRVGLQRPAVIPGWEEGLLTMKAGGKRTMIIPPQLAYGLRGQPQQKIPANATLRFEVELVSVTPGPRMTETKKEDEVATASGGRYVEIKAGDGPAVTEGSTLRLRATTWTSAGVLVSTTTDQTDVTTMELSRVNSPPIREAMLGMKSGGKRKILVPSGRPPSTQTSQPSEQEMMIVEVELVEVAAPPEKTDVPEDKLITTPSGLKYFDIKVGEGASPQESSIVKVHYTGWLTNGIMFETSTRGQPTELPLSQFIKGWTEGVGTMKVGGKRRLVISPELGYGAQNKGNIPPNSTLIFDVELLEVRAP